MSQKTDLDPEERDLLDSYERDEWRSAADKDNLQQYQAYAMSALEAAGIISILLPRQDLGALEQKAREAGTTSQKLIANILHQYLTGRLVERGGT